MRFELTVIGPIQDRTIGTMHALLPPGAPRAIHEMHVLELTSDASLDHLRRNSDELVGKVLPGFSYNALNLVALR